MNLIGLWLSRVGGVLDGEFYASLFEAPDPVHVDPIERPSGRVGCYDRDPYHYYFAEIRRLAEWCGLDCELIGAWGHPRGQRMLRFERR